MSEHDPSPIPSFVWRPESDEKPGSVDIHIDDTPPRRMHNVADLLKAAGALIIAVLAVLFALYFRGITSGVESDARTAGQAVSWLMDVPTSAMQQLVAIIIVVSVLINLIINREWLQSAVCVIAMFCGYATIWTLSSVISHVGVPSLISSIDSLGSVPGIGLLPDIYAAIGAFLTIAGTRRMRAPVKWGWNILYALAVVLIIISWNSVVGVVISLAVGRLLGMVIRFIAGTQNKGLWGMQVVQTLRNIGVDTARLERRQPNADTNAPHSVLDDDLIENARVYDVEDRGGAHYIVSALDNQMHTAGYLNQLWQWIRLSGVPMRRDRSAPDANHHHLSMILGLKNIGLPTVGVYGAVDGGESSILVFDADVTLKPCHQDTISDDDATNLMGYLHQAHIRGYTHRRITPDALARLPDGTAIIAGWHNGDCASSSANIALDQVQLLTLLSALIGVERTVAIARTVWGEDTLVRLTPFVQKVAIPKATRSLRHWNKQLFGELRDALKSLAPQEVSDSMQTVILSRFSLRSFVAITLLVIAAGVIFTQLRPDAVIAAMKNANPSMALLCIAFSILAAIGSAITLGVFMDKGKHHYFGIFCSQMAQGFMAVSMPSGVGPAFVNLQFLRKNGYRNTAATAIMSATFAVQALTTVVLMFGIGIFTGRNMLSGMIPTNLLIIIIGIIALLFSIAMAIPPFRRMLIVKYLPAVKAFGRQLVELLTQPKKLSIGVLGSLVLNIATGLGFWAALLAFGYQTNPLETTFLFLLANTLGSSVPTPGGLGAVEAALTFAFASVGVPTAISLSAALLYRVAFYWLRIPLGVLAVKWLNRHNMI